MKVKAKEILAMKVKAKESASNGIWNQGKLNQWKSKSKSLKQRKLRSRNAEAIEIKAEINKGNGN